MGRFTWSTIHHGGLSAVGVALAYLWMILFPNLCAITGAIIMIAPAFFFGREMRSHQDWREDMGRGSENISELEDLNPFVWNKEGRGDGTWDAVFPAIVAIAGSVLIYFL